MSDRIWHTTTTAAAVADRHRDTILKVVESGELHGIQRKPKGRWRIHRDCLEAWMFGRLCEHQDKG
ncbi:helix-turn-helix domain-containing protein [Nocardioides sp. J2M5]|uniref:helix-turn-helix domain-containing protein n=1 Tax=Nocardioides palaemonis TaxID=2829810 RepID=UPI001BAC418A|nr:helix-turn-helix domain-containing protein [Nocardioides palaemonis]MBS2939595.1 helix-turn-helix domain-containing protein [Nocardioides palaemonis]